MKLSFAAALLILWTAPAFAQTPPPAAVTNVVLASLTIKADADRSKFPAVMPNEVRDTVKMYLDGKIQQWWSRGDGRGVVFILNVVTVAEAKALMDTLPLSKAGLAQFDYTPLGPLTPLRMLLTEPAAPPNKNLPQ